MDDHLSLYELTTRIKDELSVSFPESYWVVAEISEIRTVRSGHCYLELIEKEASTDQVKAKVRATIWAFTYRMLKPYFESTTGQELMAGLKVLVKVSVEFQEVYGLSLNVKDIEPSFTLGDIAKKKLEVIKQLEEDGVINMNKEVPLKEVPQCFAVISSPTAAGYEDFVNQLDNNPMGYKVYHKLFPAIMQGNEAEQSIVNALDRIYNHEHYFDAVVLIRGGGSTSDLMCFDSYLIASHIAQFPLPVLTGIGHERDESVADMVAHTRLKTPTAVAEFIIDRIDQFNAYLIDVQLQFTDECRQLISSAQHRMELFEVRFPAAVKKVIQAHKQVLRDEANRLHYSVKGYFEGQLRFFSQTKEAVRYLSAKQLKTSQQELDFKKQQLKLEVIGYLKSKQNQLNLAEKTVQLSDPSSILKKGYSITSSNHSALTSAAALKVGQTIQTQLHKGQIISRIEKINPE